MAGVRMRPGLTWALYGLLAAAAAFALWGQRSPDGIPPAVASSGAWVFLLFAVGFAAYRFALVAARRYSAFKAFFQVGVMAVFFMLLLANSPRGEVGPLPPTDPTRESISALLQDPNPRVRALAAELARFRPGGNETARALVAALQDPHQTVRQTAHQTLVMLNGGTDLGPGDAPASQQAWKDRFP